MGNKRERAGYGMQLKRQAETSVKRSLRAEHLKAQGGKCFVCHKPLDFERSSLLHKHGPENTKDNTAAVHDGCAK